MKLFITLLNLVVRFFFVRIFTYKRKQKGYFWGFVFPVKPLETFTGPELTTKKHTVLVFYRGKFYNPFGLAAQVLKGRPKKKSHSDCGVDLDPAAPGSSVLRASFIVARNKTAASKIALTQLETFLGKEFYASISAKIFMEVILRKKGNPITMYQTLFPTPEGGSLGKKMFHVIAWLASPLEYREANMLAQILHEQENVEAYTFLGYMEGPTKAIRQAKFKQRQAERAEGS